MLVRLKQFLSPPIFPNDPDKTAVAKILNAIILFLFVMLAVVVIFVVVISRGFPQHLLLAIIVFVGLLCIKYLNEKGYTTAASWLIFIFFWLKYKKIRKKKNI